MVGWHHRLKGHEFEQVLGTDDGQGRLACYSPWGHQELDTTEQLNLTGPSLNIVPQIFKDNSYKSRRFQGMRSENDREQILS